MINRFKTLKTYITNRKKMIMRCALLLLFLGLIIAYHQFEKRQDAVQTSASGDAPAAAGDDGATDGAASYLFTVCIDAGHGGRDRGSDYQGRIEKADCLALALATAEKLTEQNPDVRVILTREDDASVSLSERCRLANDEGADYFVSIHRNKGRKGYGTEAWISKNAAPEAKALAQSIMTGFSEVGISRDRGVKTGSQSSKNEDYYVNRNVRMPSCLLEVGFLNSAEDNALFDEKLSAYAEVICNSILSTYELFHTQNPQEAYRALHGEETQDTLAPGSLAPTVSLTEALSPSEASGAQNTPASAEDDADDTAARISLFGEKLRTAHIPAEELAQLDNTNQEYAQGNETADRNRPSASLSCEAAYGRYNACFIGTEPLMTEEGKKVLYLTFNERYERGYTAHILDTLKERGIHATFFVTLFYAQENPALIRRMLNEGHTLGNLSATNPADGLPSLSESAQRHEVLATHTYIKNQFDYTMYLFRFPAGLFSERSLAIVNNLNYRSVFWSFSHRDYVPDDQPEPQQTYDKFIARLHPGAIYMLRCESETNSTIIGDFIDKAESLGYCFCTF